MRKVHVTQDDYGFWFISMEQPDGAMELIAHHYVAPGPAIDAAQELMDEEARRAGPAPGAPLDSASPGDAGTELVVDAPRTLPESVSGVQAEYTIPQPRRAAK